MTVNSRGTAASLWRLFLAEELASSREEPFDQMAREKDVLMLPTAIMFPYYEPDVPDYIRYGTFVTSLARATVLSYLKHGTHGSEPVAFANFTACTARNASPPSRDHVVIASATEAASNIYEAHSGGRPGESGVYKSSRPLLLTGLTSMSPWQLFYISFCYLLCTGDARNSPCNSGLLWNTQFALAFECPPESPMRANNTCKMFHHQ
ncbi:uncharacterized protein LOC144135158 [Amblyomma americanum]